MKEEIKENSESIDKFMGFHIQQYGGGMNNKFVRFNKEGLKQFESNDRYGEYHSDWNWLMRVVEKISKHVYEEQGIRDGVNTEIMIHRAYPRTFGMINNETGQFMFRFNWCGLFEADTLIEAAYMAVVEFIHWYNQNKK